MPTYQSPNAFTETPKLLLLLLLTHLNIVYCLSLSQWYKLVPRALPAGLHSQSTKTVLAGDQAPLGPWLYVVG